MSNRQLQERAPLSSRAKRGICFCAFLVGLFLFSSSAAHTPPKRPRIFGVELVRLSVTGADASNHFYWQTLGLPQGTQGCFSPMGVATCFFVNFSQQIELVPASAS